jgi:hypothetical protein
VIFAVKIKNGDTNMNLFRREELNSIVLPGRMIQKAVGPDSFSKSDKVTMGFARFAEEYGKVEPHHHAEEICYILSAKDGWVRFGPEIDQLGDKTPLEAGMTLHIPEMEWHVFGYEKGGHVEIVFIYGQVDNIRPEEKKDKAK